MPGETRRPRVARLSIQGLGPCLQLNLRCSLDLRPLPASLFGLERDEKHDSECISGSRLPVQALKKEGRRGARVHSSPSICRPSGHPVPWARLPQRVYSLHWPDPVSHCSTNASQGLICLFTFLLIYLLLYFKVHQKKFVSWLKMLSFFFFRTNNYHHSKSLMTIADNTVSYNWNLLRV